MVAILFLPQCVNKFTIKEDKILPVTHTLVVNIMFADGLVTQADIEISYSEWEWVKRLLTRPKAFNETADKNLT